MGKLYKVQVINDLSGRTIADMKVGEVGYADPLALSSDKAYLKGGYNVYHEPQGTAKMMVWRAKHGYVVDIGDMW